MLPAPSAALGIAAEDGGVSDKAKK